MHANTYSPIAVAPLDRQENLIYEVLQTPRVYPLSRGSFLEELTVVATYWDESSAPDFITPTDGATVVYGASEHRDRFGDRVLEFEVFVTSGQLPDASGASSGWFASEPRSVYTCYRLSVTFVADRVWSFYRASDFDEDPLQCPTALVDASGGGAQYHQPWEFDG